MRGINQSNADLGAYVEVLGDNGKGFLYFLVWPVAKGKK